MSRVVQVFLRQKRHSPRKKSLTHIGMQTSVTQIIKTVYGEIVSVVYTLDNFMFRRVFSEWKLKMLIGGDFTKSKFLGMSFVRD